MSLADWLRGYGQVAAAASRPEVKHTKPGGQKFIPIEEMSAEQLWYANHQNDKKAGRRTSLFNPDPDPDSFPWPT